MKERVNGVVVCFMFLVMLGSIVLISDDKVKAAANYDVIEEQIGEVDNGQIKSFNFHLPIDTKINIYFKEEKNEDSYKGTYGQCNMTISNVNQEIVYSQELDISFEDKSISVDLSAGDYALNFDASINSYSDFEYVFSVKGEGLVDCPVEKLLLSKSKINLCVFDSKTLEVGLVPYYATGDIKWSSSNKKVATVSKDGKILAKSLGTAVISCKVGTITKKCEVNVNKENIELMKGDKYNLYNSIKYIKNYKKGKSSINNKNIISVSKNIINAKSHGKSVITLKVAGKKYAITTYVYDKEKLKKDATKALKGLLKNPSSLIINKITYKGSTILIDYNAMNELGGYPRGKFKATYLYGELLYYTD